MYITQKIPYNAYVFLPIIYKKRRSFIFPLSSNTPHLCLHEPIAYLVQTSKTADDLIAKTTKSTNFRLLRLTIVR